MINYKNKNKNKMTLQCILFCVFDKVNKRKFYAIARFEKM